MTETIPERHQLVIGEFAGDVVADAVDAVLQLVVEQVADHCHAASHPLSAATKFRVVELRHGPVAILNGDQHVRDRVSRYTMSLRQVLNKLNSSIRKNGH